MVWMYRAVMAAALAAMLAGGARAETAATMDGCTASAGTPCPAQGPVRQGKPASTPGPGLLAARARMKQCGTEWKADRAAGKVADGTTWPKYLHACNARLKAAG